MEIAAGLLLELNSKGIHVKFAARLLITDDRAETGDEQNLCFSKSLHGISSSMMGLGPK
jgi:hypothetical protein